MAYNENGLECLEPNSLKLTANSIKETVENCLEENRKIKHALAAYESASQMMYQEILRKLFLLYIKT